MASRRLSPAAKLTYGLGDLTLSAGLTAMSMVYAGYFLTQEAGLRPALAGLVPLIGRAIDAITDPLMGRISDRTRWRAGRRRPYFLIGAIPYGLSFAALWIDPPFDAQSARFAYYAVAYSVYSIALTVLYVPYLALLPEMATGYDDRTSLNTYRSAVSSLGMLAAIAMRPIAEALGGESADFASAALLYAVVMALPWFAVHRVTFEPERPPAPATDTTLWQGMREVATQRSFVWLCGIYLLGRIAMDIAGALFILYATFWLGRSDDFEIVMLCFFASLLCSFPLANLLARHRNKASIYAVGAAAWALVSCLQFLVQPEWPRLLFFLLVPLLAPGFAMVDLMPWSMVGEVADEGELASGERRDGVYNGVLSFVRKFGGAIGVALILGLLDLAGFKESQGGVVVEQSETARQAIRTLSALGPAVPLVLGIFLARHYPLTRERHARMRDALDARAALVAEDRGALP